MVFTLKLLLFAILGSLVGYFVFPYITPVTDFARQESDLFLLRSINVVVGAILGLYLANKTTLRLYILLVGLTGGALVGTLLSPLVAVFTTHYLWYGVFSYPKNSPIVSDTISFVVWTLIVFFAYKISNNISGKNAT